MRVTLFDADGERYLLMLWHHIAFDGWSTDIFLKELAEVYTAFSQGKVPELPELSIQYRDYARWQREHLQGETLQQYLKYWTGRLEGIENLVLPTDRARPPQVDYRGADVRFTLDPDLSDGLRQLAREQETTLYTVML
ncbi:condensation domain-containing protein, partial [Serratia fonticola]